MACLGLMSIPSTNHRGLVLLCAPVTGRGGGEATGKIGSLYFDISNHISQFEASVSILFFTDRIAKIACRRGRLGF